MDSKLRPSPLARQQSRRHPRRPPQVDGLAGPELVRDFYACHHCLITCAGSMSASIDVALLRQSDSRQPEIIDALHETYERVPLDGLSEVAIRSVLIANLNIILRRGSAQDDGRDCFQAIVRLDANQHFPSIHFWQV